MALENPHDYHTYPYSFVEEGQHKGSMWEHHVLDKLENMHVVLQAIHATLNEPVGAEVANQRFVQTLYKSGFGGNWMPNTFGRFYLYIYAPVATALNVSSPLGAPFVLTIPAPTLPNLWNLLDLPDQSSVILDATASANQMNVYVLVTNRKL